MGIDGLDGLDTGSSWRALRAEVEEQLRPVVGAAAAAETRWILLEASGCREVDLVREDDGRVPALVRHRIGAMVERRTSGEPLQYVLGSWSFRGIDLFVDRRVLIPRPETEVVVQVALDALARQGARVGPSEPWTASVTDYPVADLGTGSGAIALALASELPDAAVWATDVDAGALAVARANLSSVGAAATRVRLAEGDWFHALPDELRGALRLVVSNPPYVSQQELGELPREVAQHEPTHALVSGPTGMEALTELVAAAPGWLAPAGVLVLELAPHQAGAIADLASRSGLLDVAVRPDLAGRPRALVARMPG